MRGHVDMDTVSQEFDDSRKQMDYSDSAENRIEELIVQKKMSDAMAAKLLCENSILQERIRTLQAENKALLKGNELMTPRK